jgi:hypothetical protein
MNEKITDLLKTWCNFANKYADTEAYIYEWQNDMDCRRLIDEIITHFPLKIRNKYQKELFEIDKIVIEKTFEVNECIWKNQNYNPHKHWYYYRMNQLVFENENGEFTKK